MPWSQYGKLVNNLNLISDLLKCNNLTHKLIVSQADVMQCEKDF